MCIIISLACYLFTYPQLLKENTSLFQGYLQYNIYADLFLGIISENKEELQILGIEDDDRGIYLFRKGVSTMVAAGSIVSPLIVSICIRAGWVMGWVEYRYLKGESTCDQYVGLYVSDTNQLRKLFAILPPYFNFSSTESEIEQVCLCNRIEDWLHVRLVEEGEFSTSSNHIIGMCFVSICYHHNYLTRNLHV